MRQFLIVKRSDDKFEFYEEGKFQFIFHRSTFRREFEAYAEVTGRGPKWVGCMLRIFLTEYPDDIHITKDKAVDNILINWSETELIEYLKILGYTVFKKKVNTEDVIETLEKRGFVVEAPSGA